METGSERAVKLYCEHRILRDAQDLWAVLHTPAFEAHLAQAIGLAEYTELEREETQDTVYRRIRVVPSIPGGFRRLLQGVGADEKVSYIEEQWRSRVEMVVRWEMTPSILADRAQIGGLIRIEPLARSQLSPNSRRSRQGATSGSGAGDRAGHRHGNACGLREVREGGFTDRVKHRIHRSPCGPDCYSPLPKTVRWRTASRCPSKPSSSLRSSS